MSVHMQEELDRLKSRLLELSSLVESIVQRAIRSVNDRDEALAKKVIEADYEIDLKEVEVEEECLKFLALYQPVAVDLRSVVAILKINNDLERIGDLAVNIAHRAKSLSQHPQLNNFDLTGMEQRVRSMLNEALKAFIKQDVERARQVGTMDDRVDEDHRGMYHKVYAAIKKDPDQVDLYIQHLSVSRYLERIADYATNIAEDVIYVIDGTIVRHNPTS